MKPPHPLVPSAFWLHFLSSPSLTALSLFPVSKPHPSGPCPIPSPRWLHEVPMLLSPRGWSSCLLCGLTRAWSHAPGPPFPAFWTPRAPAWSPTLSLLPWPRVPGACPPPQSTLVSPGGPTFSAVLPHDSYTQTHLPQGLPALRLLDAKWPSLHPLLHPPDAPRASSQEIASPTFTCI